MATRNNGACSGLKYWMLPSFVHNATLEPSRYSRNVNERMVWSSLAMEGRNNVVTIRTEVDVKVHALDVEWNQTLNTCCFLSTPLVLISCVSCIGRVKTYDSLKLNIIDYEAMWRMGSVPWRVLLTLVLPSRVRLNANLTRNNWATLWCPGMMTTLAWVVLSQVLFSKYSASVWQGWTGHCVTSGSVDLTWYSMPSEVCSRAWKRTVGNIGALTSYNMA